MNLPNISTTPDLSFLRDNLLSLLHEGATRVLFTKVDGTQRSMICTLNAKYLPAQEVTEESEETARKQNPKILSVWDIENEGWRSFRLDFVIDYGSVT